MLAIQQSLASQVLAVAGQHIEREETRLPATAHQLVKLGSAICIEGGNLAINDSTPRDECIADLEGEVLERGERMTVTRVESAASKLHKGESTETIVLQFKEPL